MDKQKAGFTLTELVLWTSGFLGISAVTVYELLKMGDDLAKVLYASN
ncbi:MAG TPA: hypothetical protein VK138_08600 [Acidiferrobacterales bacterium]|nr:hypothetical protein [Acidiferrobacterales bacterium]